ncbi:MAG TPA: ATP-binding cassette domain-containing protein [Candidatus Limnocylindria bacterium]|nr:ATP-binding cassette domain-containing protein [Candidatus Limnocylindria bacterium]
MSELLLAERIDKSFGRTPVLRGVTLAVSKAEAVGLFGPNGAGKTMLANVLSGLIPPDRGRILFEGKDITRLPMDARFRAGLARTFQIPCPFPGLTVVESVRVALLCGEPKRGEGGVPRDIEGEVESVLLRTGLFAQRFWPAAKLSQGCLRRLEFARAISCRPKLVLLDELFSGLSVKDEAELAELLRSLREDDGISFLLISHNPPLLAEMCDRVVAIEDGRVTWEGRSADLPGYLAAATGHDHGQ